MYDAHTRMYTTRVHVHVCICTMFVHVPCTLYMYKCSIITCTRMSYACVHVHVYVYMYHKRVHDTHVSYMCIHIYTFVLVPSTYTHVPYMHCTHVPHECNIIIPLHVYRYMARTCIDVHAHPIYVNIHMYRHVFCLYTCTYTYMYVHVPYTCMCMYTYTHVYTFMLNLLALHRFSLLSGKKLPSHVPYTRTRIHVCTCTMHVRRVYHTCIHLYTHATRI